MASRTKVPDATQAEVLVQSRRRCCVCYGLNRDEAVKRGQIAHIDGDRDNNVPGNLAFLCFNHHDEYDSRTSQSKGLHSKEVEAYREELYSTFGNWRSQSRRDELLNFLAFHSADYDSMVKAAIKAGGSVVFYGTEHAFDVLVTDEVDYSDSDLYLSHLEVLDRFASWGWLTFSYEENVGENDLPKINIRSERRQICDEVAKRILDGAKADPKLHSRLLRKAEYRNWKPRDQNA